MTPSSEKEFYNVYFDYRASFFIVENFSKWVEIKNSTNFSKAKLKLVGFITTFELPDELPNNRFSLNLYSLKSLNHPASIGWEQIFQEIVKYDNLITKRLPVQSLV